VGYVLADLKMNDIDMVVAPGTAELIIPERDDGLFVIQDLGRMGNNHCVICIDGLEFLNIIVVQCLLHNGYGGLDFLFRGIAFGAGRDAECRAYQQGSESLGKFHDLTPVITWCNAPLIAIHPWCYRWAVPGCRPLIPRLHFSEAILIVKYLRIYNQLLECMFLIMKQL
jgi:hypothetical protein